jgi:hypothetical protein
MFMCVHGLQELASIVVRGLSRGNSVKRGRAVSMNFARMAFLSSSECEQSAIIVHNVQRKQNIYC